MSHRVATTGLVLSAAVAAIVIVALRGISLDFTPQALFTTFAVQEDIDKRFSEHFGSTENVALIIVRSASGVEGPAPRVTTREALQYIHDLAAELAEREYAERVESITTVAIPRGGEPGELLVNSPIVGAEISDDEVETLRRAIAGTGLLQGTLISEDGDTAVVAIVLADGYEKLARLQPVIADLEALIAARAPPRGFEAEIGGLPNIRVYMIECFQRDQARLIPVALLVCAMILFFTFRWLPGVIFPSIAVGLALAFTLGVMALYGEPFNIINQVVPTLLIVIGTSDAIHLISRYGEEYRRNPSRHDAAKETLATMASACFFTSFTTAVGFGSLAVSQTTLLARFGVLSAIAVIFAYITSILFLPPALSWATPPRGLVKMGQGWVEQWTAAIVAFVLRRPGQTVLVSGAITVCLIVMAGQVTVDTTLLESFPDSDRIHQQTLMLQEELDGVLPIEVSLSADEDGRFDDPEVLNAVSEVQRWLEREPQVLSTRSYGDLLYEGWAAYSDDPSVHDMPLESRAQVAQLASLLESGRPNPIAPFVTPDRRHLRLNIQIRDDGSASTLALAERLTERLGEALDGIDGVVVELSGDAYSGSRGLDSLINDIINSFGLAFVVIFLLMTFLFRSVRIGLISIPANVLPLIATMAYMFVRDVSLNTTTAIIFSVSIGLAVDDTIHMLARFKEERKDEPDIDLAMLRAARGSGRAIVVTSVMLAGGMLVMLLSSFNPVRLFGEFVCVTLVGCLFGDLILLPALLKLFAEPPAAAPPPSAEA